MSLYLRKLLFGFLSLCCFFSLSDSIHSLNFELQNKLTKKRVNFLFPKNTIEGISKINCTLLNESIRPKSWPERIPFGVGISSDHKRIHFLLYKSFFKRQVKNIDYDKFGYLEDIGLDKKGRIFALDSENEKIFYFDLKKDLSDVKFRGVLSVPNPYRCEVDRDGQLYLLSSTNQFFSYYINRYGLATLNSDQSNAINDILKEKKCIDLTINKYFEVVVLTTDRLYKFDKDGKQLDFISLDRTFKALDNTFFGDVILLDSERSSLVKYSRSFDYLGEYVFGDSLEGIPKDITIYEDFGYVAINSEQGGVYFGMGISVDNLNLDMLRQSNSYQIRFLSTFPAKVDVKVMSLKKKVLKKFSYDQLISGQQEILWDGQSESGKKLKGKVIIEVSAKAAYSLVNRSKINKIFQLD